MELVWTINSQVNPKLTLLLTVDWDWLFDIFTQQQENGFLWWERKFTSKDHILGHKTHLAIWETAARPRRPLSMLNAWASMCKLEDLGSNTGTHMKVEGERTPQLTSTNVHLHPHAHMHAHVMVMMKNKNGSVELSRWFANRGLS